MIVNIYLLIDIKRLQFLRGSAPLEPLIKGVYLISLNGDLKGMCPLHQEYI